MIASENIRMSILQTALQGKLTEQLPTDGSVEDLLITISKKKQQMIDAGVIKKEKKLPPITQDNIFEIPSSWQWVRMQTFLDVRDGTHDSPKYFPSGIPFVTSKNISSGELDFSDVNYISKEDADKINQRSLVEENDILLAMIGSIGNPVKVHVDREFAIKNMALIKSVPDSNINMDYVLILLKYMQIKMKKDSSGGVQKFVSLSYLREFPVPLPPIEEQQRIVDRVNELLAKVDEFEKIEKRLTVVKEKFPSDLRAAILQAAMQGKLTEQLDTDSSVEEMLCLIEKNKIEALNGRINKSDKRLFIKLSEEEETPYDIPHSWKWCTLGFILNKLTDGTHKTPHYTVTGKRFLSVKDVSSGKIDFSNTKFISEEEHKALFARCNPQKGDMLLTKVGTTGVPAYVDTDEEFSLFVSVALLKFDHRFICPQFLYYLICSPLVQKQAEENTRGVGNQNWVLDKIARTQIVLPPIEEQQRIVERLDALLPLCDELTEE